MTPATTSKQIGSGLYGYRNVCQPLPSPTALTEAHVEQYRELGFIAIENVFTPVEVAAAKAAIEHLLRGGNPDFTGASFEPGIEEAALTTDERVTSARKLMNFGKYDERLQAMAEHTLLLSIIERLLDEPVRLVQEMILLKPAHIGTEKPWHQDTAYFLLEPCDKVIGTWTALDPATLENGCMHVIPGSHLQGPQPHYHERDCQLPDDPSRAARDVVVPLQPGGVLFFSGLMHHGTPPNNSPSSRWALQLHYAAQQCRVIDGAAHGMAFHDEVGYAGCAGWATSTPARSMPAHLQS